MIWASVVGGDSALASTLARCLAGRASADQIERPVRVVVAALDDVREFLPPPDLESSDPLLLIGVWRAQVYVGPWWRRDEHGCPRCLASRVTDPALPGWLAGEDGDWPAAGTTMMRGLGPQVPFIVAELVAAGPKVVSDPIGPRVYVYNTVSGAIRDYILIPDSSCLACSAEANHVPAASPGQCREPLHKLAPAVLRTRAIQHEALAQYLSPLGLFHNLGVDLQSPFGSCSVELRAIGRRATQPAMGRGLSFQDGRSVAILEGLERYCAFHNGGCQRPRVRAAYQDIADRAIYPPSLGMHPAESYATENFGYCPFSPDLVIDWVEAYSMAHRGNVLVPERIAFWGPRSDGEVSFCYTTSNGCALGSSVEEAALHGLLEVIERDAFLLAWYRQLRLPEIDLGPEALKDDAELSVLLHRCELFSRCTFRAFISTVEHGIPSLWLVAQSATGGGPMTFAGAAADLWMRPALMKGIKELTKLVLGVSYHYPGSREEGLRMLDDPSLVRSLEHHPLVNCLPEAQARFDFLLSDRDAAPAPLKTLISITSDDNLDLCADFASAVDRVLACGLDVLIVDQTMPEVRTSGLVCVKVMVPGLIPMTFGHVNRRTASLPRLIEPRVSYASALPAGAAPIELPHPFH